MDVYDKQKIGRMIAWHGDHFVYEYGIDQVIKFSKLDYLLGFEKAKQVVPHEYELFKQFFGDYLLPTQFVVSPAGRRIAGIQSKLRGRSLRISDLKDDAIRRQSREILAAYQRLVTSGHPEIDLMGHEGLFRFWDRSLGNIFITDDNQLRIFDATSLDLKRFAPFMRSGMAMLFRLDRVVQGSAIRAFKKELQLNT